MDHELMSWLYIGTRAEPKAVSVMRNRYSKAKLMSLARIRAASLREDVYVTDEHGAEIYCAEYVTPEWQADAVAEHDRLEAIGKAAF